jgi:ABC-2 type transport system ATP-binding protein
LIMAALDIRGVTKSFGSKTVVSDITLSVAAGEIFGFLGPNGAGKTTMIKMILDVLRPTRGEIELFGTSSRRTNETHRRIGFLSGDMAIDDDLTGHQYLDFVSRTYRSDGDTTHRKRIDELAHELQADLGVRIDNYSRGNKQKIGLIAAMMHQPELLILDEPSSGFDPLIQDVFVHMIRKYQSRGGTVFISSHSLGEVQKLCHRVAFLREGKLVAVTDVDEVNRTAAKRILVTAADAELHKFLSQAPKLKGLSPHGDQRAGKAELQYRGTIKPLLLFAARFDLRDLTITEPELEDAFMTYYTEPETGEGSREV